ncbi:MAG: four helix bundle protein [Candidatus Yanofskybacteria bacterium]|nr:four helix bundle protein [Candidatus Yanofskybacteria bacterium]
MIKNNPFTPPPSTTLPIIQRLIVVYKVWHEYLPRFSKDHRYTLGFKIDSFFVEIIEILYEAQYINFRRKQPYLVKASSKFDTLKFFLQILWEIGGIDNKKYIHLFNHLAEVGKMLGGWVKTINLKNQTLL